jgi:hypothetical protein
MLQSKRFSLQIAGIITNVSMINATTNEKICKMHHHNSQWKLENLKPLFAK